MFAIFMKFMQFRTRNCIAQTFCIAYRNSHGTKYIAFIFKIEHCWNWNI